HDFRVVATLPVVKQLLELYFRRAAIHGHKLLDGAGRRVGHGLRSSSTRISSCSICWTLLRALNTVATFSCNCSATAAPDRPSTAVRWNACQVCGSTRLRTRAFASSNT